MIGKIAAFAMAAIMAIGVGFAFGKTTQAATQVNETEPNNSVLRANSISAGNEVYGSMNDDDIDYFKFTLPSSGQIKLTMYTDFTFWLYVYDSGENQLKGWTWEDSGEHRYTFNLTKGTYYLRLTGRTGNYNFYYSFTSANETFPESGWGTNNMIGKANAIKTDVLYRGQFALNDSIDYYKLVMNEPGTLNMTTNSDDYIKLKIYDVKENVVWEETWGFRGECQKTITLTKGTYYFEFYVNNNGTNYNFKLTFNGIKFKDSDSTIVCGNSMNLSLENVGNWDVSWKSSNSAIAQVTDGRVLANKAGPVTIMATCEGKTVKKVLQVLYKDVTDPKKFWYEPTNALTNKGIVQGYDRQTTFKPENNCTRAQMVTFLWRLKGTPNPKASTTKFKDVKTSAYYFKAVIWATERGITTGYSKTSFKPNNVCTRAQTVTFLWRMAGKPTPKTTTNKFKDIGKKDYFYKAVLWASEKKIVEGYSNKTFRPQNKCTRRQMVTFLYKYSKNVK